MARRVKRVRKNKKARRLDRPLAKTFKNIRDYAKADTDRTVQDVVYEIRYRLLLLRHRMMGRSEEGLTREICQKCQGSITVRIRERKDGWHITRHRCLDCGRHHVIKWRSTRSGRTRFYCKLVHPGGKKMPKPVGL